MTEEETPRTEIITWSLRKHWAADRTRPCSPEPDYEVAACSRNIVGWTREQSARYSGYGFSGHLVNGWAGAVWCKRCASRRSSQ